MNYFISRDNQQYGPYTLAELQRYVAEGNILLTDLARSEASEQWLPVQQIVGNIDVNQPSAAAPNYGQVPVYPGQGMSAPPAGELDLAGLPPGLHWALVLLFGVLTCGLFNLIWMFVEAIFIKKIRPQSNAVVLYAVGIGLVIFAVILSAVDQTTRGFAPLFNLGGGVLILIGHFSLKASIEDAFHLQLSGVMTFFFNVIYFQYHFTEVRNQRLAGAVR